MSGRPGPRERFAAAVSRPDAEIDVAHATLLVAAEEYPDLDVAEYMGRFDALAEAARPAVARATSLAERVARLNHFLFVERAFRGNRDQYDDPRNSFLNDVLDRRLGIPITLSIVYVEVARRLGLPAHGVGFPAHFLSRVDGDPEVVVDAFFGTVLDRDECERRLRTVLGPDIDLVPALHLRAATAREILVRVLTNLKVGYAREEDFGRALSCCERILLLMPDAPLELRDRGLVYEQLECFAAALRDLERFLELAPDDESAAAVRDRAAELRQRVGRLH